MKGRTIVFCLISLFLSLPNADTLHVGSSQQYKTPHDAADAVQDGDVVIIDKGTYNDQATNWSANNLILRSELKYAHLVAPATISNQKAIWVVKGDNVIIENIEFSEASVPDKNGAGIRAEGSGLTIRSCYFHDNEDGILGGSGEILIENTIFEKNGYGDGYSHNLYISQTCTKLTFRYNYSHHARIGHNLKSRAKENYILYNRIMDEEDGTSSYSINLPNGGTSYIIGNLLQQGPMNDNSTIISYGEEGLSNPGKDCYIVNNTIVNDHSKGTFINIAAGADSARVINNLFVGPGTNLNGVGVETTCMEGDSTDLVDMAHFNYLLRHSSDAVDAGSNPGTANGYSLKPRYQYVHPASAKERKQIDVIDIGAYEDESNVSIVKSPKVKKTTFSILPGKNAIVISTDMNCRSGFTVSLFNVKGCILSNIFIQPNSENRYVIPFSLLSISSGVYICKIFSNKTSAVSCFSIIEKE